VKGAKGAGGHRDPSSQQKLEPGCKKFALNKIQKKKNKQKNKQKKQNVVQNKEENTSRFSGAAPCDVIPGKLQ